ncbi:MAG: NifU family protein [Bacteroidetes bacterium]|nr:NifU family protein [Bacteroidota bacterium]
MEINLAQIEEVLKRIRPYLQIDGGDVEVVNIKDESIVELRLLGSCLGCPMSQMTLRAGVERVLMKELPWVKRVEQVV